MLEEGSMQIYIGIDWSDKKHDAVLMNDQGAVIT
jgi:activator of 2-hydroxyglutaryl-CoA dehydratase